MDFDAIVIGGGHAGIEAALALSRLNFKTLMITQNLDTIGKLSCNPAIGGLAKGNMVREIDALGGEMGRIIDFSMIQFRVLNKSRGPAVQAPRAQADKLMYQTKAKETLERQDNLDLFQDTVVDFLLNSMRNEIEGVVTERGNKFRSSVVVLTTGTFLRGKIFIGEYRADMGRLAEFSAYGLDKTLLGLGFEMGRLKTGTPARIHKKSVDFSKTEVQFGDSDIIPFSFSNGKLDKSQLSCYVTYTNKKTHEIISENMHLSPLYSGEIVGNGPRYCPSIEDKIVKFKDKDRHQIFIEPEGFNTEEMYLNGLSSSLPENIQQKLINSIEGLEHAVITRPGYAVEYDYINPIELYPNLESKRVKGLFIAGQTNGSSGYEEAAAQGLMAGINAALRLQNKKPMILTRTSSYIGVLIDDLVTKGTKEPYRMFTSRAEHRLNLRHDTSDKRLIKIGYDLGLVDEERYSRYLFKESRVEEIKELLKQRRLGLKDVVDEQLKKHVSKDFYHILKDPSISLDNLIKIDPSLSDSKVILEQVELDVKYEGYINRQKDLIKRLDNLELVKLPFDFNYEIIEGLSREAREKFSKIQPATLAQASRIPGIRSTDITVLLIYFSNPKNKVVINFSL
ncbi:tRNA uridine-5-carboxymethylaminomethyl(34) synthesis enzyme MnmG [Borreliella burgdorferi]|uniref:tRNA uridine 5-carboxymethylaminomethyl modification enzyme MnmG n=1 Tax=Borreliella burgdorferi 118a TaxID=476210 RepID=A0A7U8I649_BORBG|nr:tRNA uridine-5-carboxymethylaminomethyl(34) synthesis enzyme MnmG [Borreliella burgdorferi]AXK70174.1 tRNA uridine 5-carboxymethylaminomethyl modification enzyme GidA [Borreliella burgdorferi]EEE18827.1 tRNA uridine 5-carboxymethylaminomethyl modification enzyme GidA [Borreliella burgdorferi 72a]EEG99065.1 tRNA uridine 5-carboxymethylaminomethyl modification enzyme GidA [Borreliella burgdorferi 118a]EEH00234.1 tRNA uridine 5-carboxymethylaminomethyl modification enzyme GidA [Borreliella burg